jgi:Kef-type K+ transport system membrane component KefB
VLQRVGVVVLAVLLTTDAVVVAALAFLVVSSLTGSASDDPHGYAVIFGVVALFVVVPIGLVLLGLLRRIAGSAR